MYLKDRTFISSLSLSLSLSNDLFFTRLPLNGRCKEEEGGGGDGVRVFFPLLRFFFVVFLFFFFFSLSFVRLFSDCITAKEKMYAQIYFDGRGSPLYAARLPRWIWIFVQHRCARVFPPSGAHILPRVRAQWCSLLPREQRLAPPPPSFRERYRRIFLCATRIIKSSDPSLRCTSTNVYIRYNNSWNRSNPLILEFEIRLYDDEKL